MHVSQPSTGLHQPLLQLVSDRQRPVLDSSGQCRSSPQVAQIVNFRFGKLGIGSKHHFHSQFLSVLDLWQKQLIPVLSTVHVAGPQLRRQIITLAIEQQQRVIAGRFKVPVSAGVRLNYPTLKQ